MSASAELFRPGDQDVLEDPYPTFSALREQAPAYWTDWSGGFWLITRYEDVKRIVRDNTMRNTKEGVDMGARLVGGPAEPMFRSLLSRNNAPNHVRLRKLGEAALGPKALRESIQPRLQALVDETFDSISGRDTVDAMADIALDMPLRAFCRLLDIPDEDRHVLNPWMPDYFRIFVPDESTDAGIEALQGSVESFIDYFSPYIEERRKDPGDDMISLLVAAEVDGERFSDAEVHSMIQQTIAGGFDTVPAVLAAAVYNFARQPDQFELLRANPEELARPAAEEMYRWESPVQMMPRFTTDDLDISGTTIPPGERLAMVVASANRDATAFDNPDEIKIDRQEPKHIGFGGGRHFCLGNHLARMETEVFVATMARRWKSVELAGEPQRKAETLLFRSFESVPVSFTEA